MTEKNFQGDLERLLNVLPESITKNLEGKDLSECIEIVMDLGRTAEVRFSDGKIDYLGTEIVTQNDIDFVVELIDDFTSDNRAGIPGTLHRISAIRNRKGIIIGLTCRIGRAITGTIECIKDLVQTGKSILLLGKPGVGKTTKLREVAFMLANELGKRVVVVDTSNEIAGDGDIPHSAIGKARRMQVTRPELQKHVMIEAVENHTPECVIVDEIGTEEETLAARTIAERGVALVATAHGNTLDNLIKNPVLWDLVGGVKSVTLGDEEARRRGTQKTILEREKEPTFQVVIEIRDRNTLAVYPETAEAVDSILRGYTVYPEIRRSDVPADKVKVLQTSYKPVQLSTSQKPIEPPLPDINDEYKSVYIYALSRSIVEKVINRLDIPITVTRTIDNADMVLALRNYAKSGSKILSVARKYELPIYFARANTLPQIQHAILQAMDIDYKESDKENQEYYDETEIALEEAKEAIHKVLEKEVPVSLKPRQPQIRKLQHELIIKHNLYSTSVGEGSDRHIKIMPKDMQIEDAG
ncbi:MAG: R3H domain-containing nucleic acid-binding protein [Cyanobacteriota bacterium]